MCDYCIKHNPFHREKAGEVFRHVQLLREKAKSQRMLNALKYERQNLRLETSRIARVKQGVKHTVLHDGHRARKAVSGLRAIWKHL